MPDNTTEYRAKYTQIMQVPAPDDLINGWYTAAPITLTGTGDILRGTLLMSTSAGAFTPATESGLASAEELCVLCDEVTGLEEGQTARAEGYFSGEFLGARLILSYETGETPHSSLIDAIKPILRKHKLMVK